tara:strand:- start:183 stop:407 length:225 start_codon:yes stop_codon:yes gene_type:complete
MPHDTLWDVELQEELMGESDYDIYIHMKILEAEVGVLRSRFRQHDTGNIRTAVSVLSRRIEELENKLTEKVNGV